MRPLARLGLLGTLALAGCGLHGQRRAEAQSVRAFMGSVAQDVSREGRAAWRAKFAAGPWER